MKKSFNTKPSSVFVSQYKNVCEYASKYKHVSVYENISEYKDFLENKNFSEYKNSSEYENICEVLILNRLGNHKKQLLHKCREISTV